MVLESIWNQRDSSVELIVIDGGSTDGSQEWLNRQNSRIATLISEPDSGVYDAMNKGIALARGQWLLFLGSDDRLATDHVLGDVLGKLAGIKPGVVAGTASYVDGRVYSLRPKIQPLRRNFVHHQAAFYHHSLFKTHERYDRSLAVMADYDFNLRLWTRGIPFTPLPLHIAVCGTGGLSDRGGWRGYREEIIVRHRYFSAVRCVLWDTFSILRYLRKQAVCRLSRSHG
jgi:putative colanic acid biosynthesis glycosyltransferase